MILPIPAVHRDNSIPAVGIAQLVPTAFPILWPKWGDGTLKLTVSRQDGTALDLTGWTVILGVRLFATDAAAVISRQATITDAATGKAEIAIVPADTASLVADRVYSYDIEGTDAAGKRWQLVPCSSFEIDPVFAQPADAITVPAAATPLALGPAWLDLDEGTEVQTDTTTAEQLSPLHERVWNFDDATAALANLFARLVALGRVTGGSGTIRVRWGGTAGVADGTVILAITGVIGTSYGIVAGSATVVKPTGNQLVKLTLENDTPGQRTLLRSASLRARGAS